MSHWAWHTEHGSVELPEAVNLEFELGKDQREDEEGPYQDQAVRDQMQEKLVSLRESHQ